MGERAAAAGINLAERWTSCLRNGGRQLVDKLLVTIAVTSWQVVTATILHLVIRAEVTVIGTTSARMV